MTLLSRNAHVGFDDCLSQARQLEVQGLRFTASGTAILKGRAVRDGAIRIRATLESANQNVMARRIDRVGSYYLKMVATGRRVELSRSSSGGNRTPLKVFSLREPIKRGQEYTMELRVSGETLTVRVNDEVLGSVSDAALREENFEVNTGVSDPHDVPPLVKS